MRERRLAWVGHVCERLELLDGPEIPSSLWLDLWRALILRAIQFARSLPRVRGLAGVWKDMGLRADVHRDYILLGNTSVAGRLSDV